MLYILPQVAIGVKVFSSSLKFITGSNLTQWLDKANLSFTALGHTFSTGASTSVKGYEAAVQSLSKEVLKGNITAEESATILNIVGQKMGIAKSSTNVLASAEQALNAQVAAGTITKQEATIALDALKLKTAANATTSAAATASNTALAASQRAVMMSSLALSAIIAGVTLGISALIIGFYSFHRSVSDIRNDITDLSQKMNETNESDQLLKRYKSLEDQLKKTSKSSEEYNNIQSQVLEVQRQLAEKFPTLISGYDAEGKAIATNYEALKKYNDEKKIQIAGEQGKNYDDLKDKLTNSVGSWQMNQIDIYNSKKQQMDTYEKNGQWEKYDNAASSIKDISKNIDSLNNSAATLYYALGRDTEMFDTQTGKWIKYSQFIKQNSSITEGNTSKKKDNTDANLENGDAIEKASEQVDNAYTIQQKYQQALTTSTDNVKDYSKYIKEMNDNSGHLKAASVEDIVKNHPELIQYLGDEKTLYDQINNAIDTNKENAQQAYMGMMVSREQNNQQLVEEIQTYQQLESSHKTDTETRKQMSDIAKSLAGQIEGLIVITDAEGNSRIQNIGLLNSQMNMLSQEGEAYKALANVKISTTKESSIIDTGVTQTTYANAKTRIGVIMAEVQALQAKRDAEAAVASAGGAMDMPTDKAFKPYNDEINAKQADIQKIQDAMSSLDKIWNDSGKYKSSVLDNMDTASEGGYKTTKSKADTEASKALTAESRNIANRERELDVESKGLDAQRKALELQKKHAQDSLEEGYCYVSNYLILKKSNYFSLKLVIMW
ncbi:hypothetical protein CPAST_c25760 [Clostridium pasteurianum DSM 525 = ATCC 6013]|uniref:Uncharacterized protein n=2 Tax=Clostridium pasteurianum TaxID=1501 RepID=A0A0H3JAK5_CLOPA|nr:hypothetical protein [Clostridium pasteurianum]AJA48645.1 hypothetical protein CPAST_c25760 [Clostridium pasteurianum DSM 525 = ATCC 6013]AJA52633.1 hypothetical protein CLPA_c25760 [Clostridium pasteurianum DSM 525 = ATCC 6013]AOZ75874.1 hypothetical protein AQ983_12520 [Clostridium pasteurianum DSM 525 = ATCC 6013]KRU11357.1 hypothetical protein CP6013_00604 [Clostridium pasteurianum DSM 525 = ATCC 6013]